MTRRQPNLLLQTYAFFGAAVAWSAHLLISYPLVPVACHSGQFVWLHLVTAATLIVGLGSVAVAYWAMKAANGNAVADRVRFVGGIGFWMGWIFIVAIVFGGVANVVLDPCERGF